MYIVTIENGGVRTEIHGVTNKLSSGSVVKGINSIDTFSFSILPSNIGFNRLREFTTLVNVYNTNRKRYEFHGRVLYSNPSMDSSGLIKQEVTCESYMGFLCDSMQDYVDTRNWTVRDLLQHIINTHNAKVEAYKRFVLGEVNVTDPNDNLYLGIQRENTWETLKKKLVETVGGEFRFRVVDGVIYLDYLTAIGTTRTTTIALSKNMQSITKEKDPSAYITRLIPLGSKIKDEEGNDTEVRVTIASENGGLTYIDDEQAIAQYGIHEGIQTWDDVTQPNILKTKARNWLAQNNKVQVKYAITALDLSLLGLEIDDLEIGSKYPVKNELLGVDDVARIIKQTLDICNEVSSSIEIGENFKTLSDLQIEQQNKLLAAVNVVERIESNYVTNEKLTHETLELNSLINQTSQDIVLQVSEEINGLEQEVGALQVTTGAVATKVADIEGDIATFVATAESLEGKVANAEGQMTAVTQTANTAMTKAENAEGQMAEMALAVDEIRKMVGVQTGQKSYVQWDEPEGVGYGDLWVRTGTARWVTLRANTWANVGTKPWSAHYTPYPETMVWDGNAWQTVSDQRIIVEQSTLVEQTADKIEQTALKAEENAGILEQHETKFKQHAEQINLKAAQSDMDGLEKSVAEMKLEADAVETRVQNAEGEISELEQRAGAIEQSVQGAEEQIDGLGTRISTAENKIKPEAITNTVRTSTEYKNDLAGKANTSDLAKKVDQTVFDQTNSAFDLRVQTVENNSGKAETVTNTAMTLNSSGFHLKTGGTFTVDSGNFDVDANGNVAMLNASVSGNLTNNGIAVLTAKNLVVSSTQPTNPVAGMVWVKPVGSTAATFLYNNTSVQSFKAFESAHTMTNAGTAITASGTYTYNVKIPYKVTGDVNATRYLTMMVGNTAIFTDIALEKKAGTYVLELNGSLSAWLGNANSLTFTLNLHYMTGDDGTLYNVHRVDVGAIDLKLYAKSNASSGWSGTEVQVYNG